MNQKNASFCEKGVESSVIEAILWVTLFIGFRGLSATAQMNRDAPGPKTGMDMPIRQQAVKPPNLPEIL